MAQVRTTSLPGDIPQRNELVLYGSKLVVGDGTTAVSELLSIGGSGASSGGNAFGGYFEHTLTSEESNIAFKFVYVGSGAPADIIINSIGCTHVRLLRWDGTYTSPVPLDWPGDDSYISSASWGSAPVSPYNSKMPKFSAVIPCNSLGQIGGVIKAVTSTSNSIIAIDVSALTDLYQVNFFNNELQNLDLLGLNLSTVMLGNNRLTSVDLRGSTGLVILNLSNNRISSFSTSNVSVANLSTLDLSNNRLTSFSTTGFEQLTSLILDGNRLSSLVMTSATNVEVLSVNDNNLSSLDVSSLTNLNQLSLSGNPNITSSPLMIDYVINSIKSVATNGSVYFGTETVYRTADSDTAYNALIAAGWTFSDILYD